MTLPTPELFQALLAQPADADRLMRDACAALRHKPPAPAPVEADALRAGLACIAPLPDKGLDTVLQRLLDDAPLGAATDGIAALLRPPMLAWDEAQELDWAVRHWQACKADGQLDDDLAADFGEYWRRLEWSALRHHLVVLGQGHAESRRLLAYIAKTASRYVALGPLKRAMETRLPEFFELGFTLK